MKNVVKVEDRGKDRKNNGVNNVEEDRPQARPSTRHSLSLPWAGGGSLEAAVRHTPVLSDRSLSWIRESPVRASGGGSRGDYELSQVGDPLASVTAV